MTTSELAIAELVTAADLEAFPPDFLFGAATASYQIEGAVDEGGRSPSIWDTFCHTAGTTRDGHTGDVACDHYHRWRDDVALIGDLGLGAYRLSVAWPRLQPTGSGALNPAGLAFYRNLLESLRHIGVQPFVTLYHWDLPQVLEDAGGWPNRDTAGRFAEFAGSVVGALGDLVAGWITLNEPWCQAFLGYGNGVHAPGRRDYRDAVAAAHHLSVAHGLATQAIRSVQADASVGITHILTDVLPASASRDDVAAAGRVDANANLFFLESMLAGGYGDAVRAVHDPFGLNEIVRDGDAAVIAEPIDFLGVNHYHQVLVEYDPRDPFLGATSRQAPPATTSLGWSVRPESLCNVLVRVTREFRQIPLYVTENGASFDDRPGPDGAIHDSARIAYLAQYLAAAATAIRDGVDLRGYFAWSLLDNFEWAEGYSKRFGLVFIDYDTQARTPKASFSWYRQLIDRHRTSRRTAAAPRVTQDRSESERAINHHDEG